MTEPGTDQYDYEPIDDQYQTFLRSSEDCARHHVEQQTPPRFLRTTYGFYLPVSAFAIDAVLLHRQHFAGQKPIVNFRALGLNGYHRYDRHGLVLLGLAKKRLPSGDEYTWNCFDQEKLSNSLLCEPKALVSKIFHVVHGVLGFYRVYLTNLREHCLGYLQNIGHLCRVFLPKTHPFGSPFGGL